MSSKEISSSPTTIAKTEITLAVLPWQITGEAESIQIVMSGFTEDLITNFSRFVGLAVISNFSTQSLRAPFDPQVLRQLGADYLVTGSCRQHGEQVKINVQLVRSSDFTIVFANHYSETLDTLFDTQDEIIRQIVSILQQYIDYDLLSYSYRKKKVQLAAYENWLLGMDHLKKGTLDSDLQARTYFESALRIDSGFARAYTGISLTYFNEWSCQLWDRWEVSQRGAHKYALKALEIDENDYVALAVCGRCFVYAEAYERAEVCLRKSLQMNPNDARNLIRIAFSLIFLGYAEEAIELYEKAVQLNPVRKDAYLPYGATFYFEAGNFEKALELGRQVDLANAWVDFPAFLAAASYYLGQETQAHHYWRQYLEAFKNHIILGEETQAHQALEWQINVNPYRDGKTQLNKFWAYIGGVNYSPPAAEQLMHQDAYFSVKGEFWELCYQGETVAVKDAKGLHDIARLLTEPEKAIHCVELIGATIEDGSATLTLDAQAKQNYQNRLRRLQIQIEEAEMYQHSEQLVQLQEEYDQLIDHLSGALGLAGKARKVGSPIEKARSAVTWRIRSAIKKIESQHPALGRHLSQSIKTGTLCRYQPELDVHWII